MCVGKVCSILPKTPTSHPAPNYPCKLRLLNPVGINIHPSIYSNSPKLTFHYNHVLPLPAKHPPHPPPNSIPPPNPAPLSPHTTPSPPPLHKPRRLLLHQTASPPSQPRFSRKTHLHMECHRASGNEIRAAGRVSGVCKFFSRG